ncbi:dTDP-glucose 4,6-dehydratase [Rhizobium sp. R635]|uniref:dTDP-glucose 4,6-dehydratase n=1 Tax=Rhizobium sp. R635 TaxID=1764275 RepID=UPI000B52C639|nr:dTDP-glucose 4,6-dehydratase [Rhizobium sp. R635]OWV89205.1 dTDP-glucose 4,6-dehydratase [Rhizobium sp. R635]
MTILVTGGAGFIGSNFILQWLINKNQRIVNLDKLTYAGNLENLSAIEGDPRYKFVRADIGDAEMVSDILRSENVKSVINFAAESHVDRSIASPEQFIQTNLVGTFNLLEASRTFFDELDGEAKSGFRFLHVSTDEIFGTLGPNDPPFDEETPIRPNSPYSATKAGSDHLVRSYFETYKLPALITNCSNNYGPRHFPEKLIPLIIHRALKGEQLPVYGDGKQIRDWLYVDDHCEAIRNVLEHGTPGQTYNIGGNNEITNLDVVNKICALLDDLSPREDRQSYVSQVSFVTDRPGHDRRYAINATKIRHELGWSPKETFESGLRKTVLWYLANSQWTENVTSGEYRQWIDRQYASERKAWQ